MDYTSCNLSSRYLDTIRLSIWKNGTIVMVFDVLISEINENGQHKYSYEYWHLDSAVTKSLLSKIYIDRGKIEKLNMDIKEAHAMMVGQLFYEKFIELVNLY